MYQELLSLERGSLTMCFHSRRIITLVLTAAISLTIAFGIAVDDTIHLINRTHRLRAETGAPWHDCVAQAVHQVIPAIVATTIILFIGFSVSALSALPSIALFGMLAAGATLIACVADIAFLPSLMLLRRDKTR